MAVRLALQCREIEDGSFNIKFSDMYPSKIELVLSLVYKIIKNIGGWLHQQPKASIPEVIDIKLVPS
jgi:hypothetical protein